MRPFTLAALAAFGLVAQLATPAFADSSNLAGTYAVKGWNPGHAVGGTADYTGTFLLRKNADAYTAIWTIDTKYSGPAVVKQVGGKQVLAVGYMFEKKPGVAFYEVSADGNTLTGEWAASGNVGHEVLTRK